MFTSVKLINMVGSGDEDGATGWKVEGRGGVFVLSLHVPIKCTVRREPTYCPITTRAEEFIKYEDYWCNES